MDRPRRSPAWRPPLRHVLGAFLAWTAYSLLLVVYLTGFGQAAGTPARPLAPMLVRWLLQGWTWLALTYPVLAVARRWPFRRAGLARAIVIHTAAFAACQVVLGIVDRIVAFGFYHVVDRQFFYLFSTTRVNAIGYALLVAGEHAYRNGRASARSELEAAELRQRLAEAQLGALRARLQPHFLFNVLHGIAEMIHEDPERADVALARIGDLLRWSLATADRQEIPLDEELRALDAYAAVQRLRFPDAFALAVRSPAAAADLAVPSFVLQPLVENAVQHGGGERGVQVDVDVRVTGESLELVVRDRGPGLARPAPAEGTGLGVTRARIEGLYGAAGRLEVRSAEGGGACVTVTLPARRIDGTRPGMSIGNAVATDAAAAMAASVSTERAAAVRITPLAAESGS